MTTMCEDAYTTVSSHAKNLKKKYLVFKGYYAPNQKSAFFVLYLKIINTFLKNNIL